MQVLQVGKRRDQGQRERTKRCCMDVGELFHRERLEKGAAFDVTVKVADELDSVKVRAGGHAVDQLGSHHVQIGLDEIDVQNSASGNRLMQNPGKKVKENVVLTECVALLLVR
jgi:hypothetical protein